MICRQSVPLVFFKAENLEYSEIICTQGANKNDAFVFLGLLLPKRQNKYVLKCLFMQLLLK